MLNKFRSGFTLMEIIIVLGLIGIILPVIFTIIFSITRQQVSLYVLSTVKREGDNALNIMESLIRNNGVSVYNNQNLSTQECVSIDYNGGTGTNFYITDKTGQWFKFSLINNEIASSSSVLSTPISLTSSSNTTISSFNINCGYTSDLSQPVVGISFTIEQKTSQTYRETEKSSLNYSTKIKLR